MICAKLSWGKIMLSVHTDNLKWACNFEVFRRLEMIGYKSFKLSLGPHSHRKKNWRRLRIWSWATKVIFSLYLSPRYPLLCNHLSPQRILIKILISVDKSSSRNNNNEEEENMEKLYVKRAKKDIRGPQNKKNLKTTSKASPVLPSCVR